MVVISSQTSGPVFYQVDIMTEHSHNKLFFEVEVNL